jgi:ribosome-binding protein aMBF1 (putative translation factor)
MKQARKKYNKGNTKEQKLLDAKFEKYVGMLPQSYFDQFSKSKIPKEIANQIQKIRNEKNLSQEELANLIEENVLAIRNLENCKGSYNTKLVEKIEKALNITFDKS